MKNLYVEETVFVKKIITYVIQRKLCVKDLYKSERKHI